MDMCGPARDRLRHAVLDHSSCQADADCIGESLKPLPDACCYVANRQWWTSTDKQRLVHEVFMYCGRATYRCYSRCESRCENGKCRSVVRGPAEDAGAG